MSELTEEETATLVERIRTHIKETYDELCEDPYADTSYFNYDPSSLLKLGGSYEDYFRLLPQALDSIEGHDFSISSVEIVTS